MNLRHVTSAVGGIAVGLFSLPSVGVSGAVPMAVISGVFLLAMLSTRPRDPPLGPHH